jgi:hypothetical protein
LANPHAPPLESNPDGNLVLELNNECRVNLPIDFNVFIDGHPAYSGNIGFTPKGMEARRFKVTKGPHVIYVNSKKVNTWTAQSIEVDEKVWVYISFWYYPNWELQDGGPITPHFEIMYLLVPAPIY